MKRQHPQEAASQESACQQNVRVGFTLQPEPLFLELLDSVFREAVDYFVIAPETTWRFGRDGSLSDNGFHKLFRALGDEAGCDFVGHGVGLSLGAAGEESAKHRARWLQRLAKDHEIFSFLWYTDHLGNTSTGRLRPILPLPPLMSPESARLVRRDLTELQKIIPLVGVENTAHHFTLGDPLRDPEWINEILKDSEAHMLLDLHNVFTMSKNLGFDPHDYLDHLPLEKVIEIHISGGSESLSGWLPEGRTLRLDSHDDAVPEEVWKLLCEVLPRCPNLRGVTLERMEGTVKTQDVPKIRAELLRLRGLVEVQNSQATSTPKQVRKSSASPRFCRQSSEKKTASSLDPALVETFQHAFTEAICAEDPIQNLQRLSLDPRFPPSIQRDLQNLNEDGVRISGMIIARLRFERLLRASSAAARWYEEDTRDFVMSFRKYHHSTTPSALFPLEEAELFLHWCSKQDT